MLARADLRNRVGWIALGVVLVSGAGLAHSAIPDNHKVIHACYDPDGTLHVIDTEAGDECGRTQVALDWNQSGPAGPAGPAGLAGPAGPAGPPGPATGDPAPRPGDIEAERAELTKLLARKPKKPSLKLVKKLAGAPTAASEARSTYLDANVVVPGPGSGGKTVASLGLPAGRWVIHAKALTQYSMADLTFPHLTPRISCLLQAGTDSDNAYATEGTLAPQVVHRFTKPGLAELSCFAFPFDMVLKRIKITAIRVSKLTNTSAASQ